MSKLKPEYRALANPKQLRNFREGRGILADRQQVTEHFDYDWHARKLTFESHFRGHLLMQATAYNSTRDHQWAGAHDPLFIANGASVQISASGLAQANRKRPIEPLVILVQAVMQAVANLPAPKLRTLDKRTWQGIVDLLRRTDLFDATTLKLPPKLRQCMPGKHEGTSALKMQLRIDGWRGDFKKIMFTPEPGSDSPYLNDLLGDLEAQEGQIFVFDGGYWKLETCHQIVDSGNDFVTKRGGKIKPHPVKNMRFPQEPLASEYEVLQGALVYLGKRRDRIYRRLKVRQTNGHQVTLLTSLVGLSADAICLLYRYRSTIELVFRWLRQTLQLDHLRSHDPIGVVRKILIALIVWGLLVIANQDPGKLRPKQLWRQLQADIHQAVLELGYRLGFKGALSLLVE